MPLDSTGQPQGFGHIRGQGIDVKEILLFTWRSLARVDAPDEMQAESVGDKYVPETNGWAQKSVTDTGGI